MSELALKSPSPNGRQPKSVVEASRRLLSPEAEARVFWQMRRRQMVCVLRQNLSEARLRLSLIVILSGMLWAGLFYLFLDGFWFLDLMITAPDLYDRTVQAVFGMFFMALMIMLVFSSGVLLYGSLFRARDLPLLMTLPARAERIFLHKFQEAILMSSWAFLLLGSPMLLAYGVQAAAPWYFYLMVAPFLLAFVYIPAALGAILCLAIVHWLPRVRAAGLVLSGVASLVGLGLTLWSLFGTPHNDLLTPDWFQEMLGRLRLTEHRLLPSWWLSTGLLQAASGVASESVLFLTLLFSNALFFRLLAVGSAGWLYRRAYHRLHGRLGSRRKVRVAWIDWFAERLAARLPRQVGLLIIKDFRLFRRDPVQWLQFLIFFGLLTLYFVSVRRFHYDMFYAGWVNMVSFLNVSVVGLLLSTFTTRFIFPMISLEGRRFWILGLLPLRRETILWSKLWFAVGGSIVPCSVLILLSDAMLRISPAVMLSHQVTCVILCFGLAGISVGMGAKMPSFRESSPAKIAAGFGGTLTLVVSTLFIIVVVLLTALPTHFYLTADSSGALSLFEGHSRVESVFRVWFFAGIVGSIVLGVLATWLPMRLGARAFRALEL